MVLQASVTFWGYDSGRQRLSSDDVLISSGSSHWHDMNKWILYTFDSIHTVHAAIYLSEEEILNALPVRPFAGAIHLHANLHTNTNTCRI